MLQSLRANVGVEMIGKREIKRKGGRGWVSRRDLPNLIWVKVSPVKVESSPFAFTRKPGLLYKGLNRPRLVTKKFL